MQDGEPNVYAAVVTMRNTYLTMQWQRVQIFLTFNVVAIPILFGTDVVLALKQTVSIVGLAMHVGLLIATNRAEDWIRFYDQKLATLERFALVDPSETRVRVPIFSDEDFIGYRSKKGTSRRVFGGVGTVLMLYWLWNCFHFYFE